MSGAQMITTDALMTYESGVTCNAIKTVDHVSTFFRLISPPLRRNNNFFVSVAKLTLTLFTAPTVNLPVLLRWLTILLRSPAGLRSSGTVNRVDATSVAPTLPNPSQDHCP